MTHSLAVAEPEIGSKTNLPSVLSLSIACPCPIVADVAERNDWGFTEPCPKNYLQPGDIISSPGRRFAYEILSYPFSRLYLDFRGLIAGVRGTEVIDTPQRQFYKCLFLLLALAIAEQQIYLPIWLLLGLTGRLMPHLDNSAWTGYPIRRPVRPYRGNYLSYQRRLVGGQMVETFTLRWSASER
ncbi:MAG: hypothetical protein CLLPBCKN_006934 [Chroococcidiopsis cubana SAG 39.79]|uniref:Uncharacterized protein n=1 Tax=Chroococcidiopsis cubana SAG 39.79 TaxID=388085 RepID=A0AB37U8I6_9CYAN|nr:hypothetical protein [Chroococcidiopsis cubana]MDZ4877499.1 hypothetical protein [Chroococcidiopsis cubana SAG 39.79]PSB55890.1 hypothetical protein C7B79_32915 [Chroococcidiopsis cubana CCALA 043]RUS95931.1 hypothetical protein DSM107010_70980 [Chroococcidiopsis cubana SAG 39.79]